MHLGIFKDHQCILRDHLCIFQEGEHSHFTWLSINPAPLKAPGTGQAERFATFIIIAAFGEKIKSNDGHDDDDDSDDASTFASLTFVAKFGGENNQEKDDNYDGDVDDDSDCCEHACIFNLYRYIWRREQPGRWWWE